MRSIGYAIIFTPAFVACSMGSSSDELDIGAVADRLVGGHVATEAEYPATVHIGNCTAAKVGPRHFLTAAHCVDGGLTTLEVTSRNDAKYRKELTVEALHIPTAWTDCPNCGCEEPWLCDMVDKPDVALVIVEEETPDVVEAAIDDTPVLPGDAVVLAGYGCENGVGQPSGPPRLKVHETVAVDSLTIAPDTPGVAESYVVTDGPDRDPDAAGLCPGDSGGPVYRGGVSRPLVVGINALVVYRSDTGMPIANFHTRLDQDSSQQVFDWLESLGANVETGETCDDGVLNGSESAVDCGGSCAPCPSDLTCNTDADCMVRDCVDGQCAELPTWEFGPCLDICENPVEIEDQYFSATFGTEERCYQTDAYMLAGSCGGFTSPRTFSVNGEVIDCDAGNFTMPERRNEGYCFYATEGNEAWAYVSTW